jgi:hypothetical protein
VEIGGSESAAHIAASSAPASTPSASASRRRKRRQAATTPARKGAPVDADDVTPTRVAAVVASTPGVTTRASARKVAARR